MTKVIALKPHRYGSRQYQTGQEYEIRRSDELRLYTILGWVAECSAVSPVAAPAPQIEQPKPRTYARRDLIAETPVAVEAPVEQLVQPVETTAGAPADQPEETQPAAEAKPRRTYRRRDATAE